MNEMNLSGRLVGDAHPPLVVAEIGINHGGCIETAKLMVDAAFRAGVEVVKHQTHVVEDEMSESAKTVIPGNSTESIFKIMATAALSESDEKTLKEYVEGKGMIFISTPFSRAAADRLEAMGVIGYKIGSGECNNYPLVRHIAKFGKPVILSTGMNTIKSIAKSVAIFEEYGISYALLHTTNVYPTPHHLVRLGAMLEIRKNFPKAIIGLSDHTTDNIACIGAVALGASVIERHFTDSMQREGPDIICSMDERACRELIKATKILFTELGGSKEPVKEEKITMDFAFATVVATKDIKSGEVLSEENLWVKRPGTGDISAENLTKMYGRVAAKDIKKDTHLSYTDALDTI